MGTLVSIACSRPLAASASSPSGFSTSNSDCSHFPPLDTMSSKRACATRAVPFFFPFFPPAAASAAALSSSSFRAASWISSRATPGALLMPLSVNTRPVDLWSNVRPRPLRGPPVRGHSNGASAPGRTPVSSCAAPPLSLQQGRKMSQRTLLQKIAPTRAVCCAEGTRVRYAMTGSPKACQLRRIEWASCQEYARVPNPSCEACSG